MQRKRAVKSEKFYDGWLYALSKGKIKERTSALSDINQWIKRPESEVELDGQDWRKVITSMMTALD